MLQMNLPLETTVNDTKISRKSFQKSRKLLSFGKRTIQPKILKIPGARFNGKNFREKISKILVYLAKLSSFLEILGNAVPFATGSCRKFKPRPKFRTGKFRSRTAFTI